MYVPGDTMSIIICNPCWPAKSEKTMPAQDINPLARAGWQREWIGHEQIDIK
ncbi:hypothetical protein ASZ90_012512 [hydrocarbon metagenome]|uniref:Uncharacterized protein n=1 Tax=hydrocarbon metagenome TaxID=938273 RepID=A0A0W8FAA5_9ZZZZ